MILSNFSWTEILPYTLPVILSFISANTHMYSLVKKHKVGILYVREHWQSNLCAHLPIVHKSVDNKIKIKILYSCACVFMQVLFLPFILLSVYFHTYNHR